MYDNLHNKKNSALQQKQQKCTNLVCLIQYSNHQIPAVVYKMKYQSLFQFLPGFLLLWRVVKRKSYRSNAIKFALKAIPRLLQM